MVDLEKTVTQKGIQKGRCTSGKERTEVDQVMMSDSYYMGFQFEKGYDRRGSPGHMRTNSRRDLSEETIGCLFYVIINYGSCQ